MRYFDSHCHVNFAAYDGDREETILRAKEAGVAMNVVGTQKDTSASAVALAEKYDNVYATIGLASCAYDQVVPRCERAWSLLRRATEGKEGFVSRGRSF